MSRPKATLCLSARSCAFWQLRPRWQRTGRSGLPIPGSVRAVIGRRLTPLSADAVQVLSAAAVVGREFDLALVVPACQLPVERVLESLSEAVAPLAW